MSLKAIIIDDEEDAIEVLTNIISEFADNVEVIGQAHGVAEGAKLLRTMTPDILFLDVQMQDGSGFDLLDLIAPFHFKVIFVTAYDKYAVKAFNYSALDYLLKPVGPLNLVNAIKKHEIETERFNNFQQQIELLKANTNNKISKIAVPTSDGVKFIKMENIIHCQSDGCYTIFNLTEKRKLTVTRTLKEYAELLSDEIFQRIHKSHLINLNYVEQYVNRDGGMVIMENANTLPISRNRKDDFLRKLNLK